MGLSWLTHAAQALLATGLYLLGPRASEAHSQVKSHATAMCKVCELARVNELY